MKLVSIGKNAKVHNLNVKRNIIVTDDISKIDSLIDIQENGEIIHLDADGNEVHTPDSYANKMAPIRNANIYALEIEILKLNNDVTKAKLSNALDKMKNFPPTIESEWEFKNSLTKLKEFASDLGAKVVAEIAMKQLGY